MNICAVICEFNPFHNGHEYLLKQAKIKTNADIILCIMSGNFVQRAEPAIIDKSFRTKFCLENGADIVVELPTIFASGNGEKFAHGAVNIINYFSNVTHIAFGCEHDNINILKKAAKIQLEESEPFKKILKDNLSKGLSYPKSIENATINILKNENTLPNSLTNFLSQPNNILAMNYIKEFLKLNSKINFTPIKRKGSNYNDTSINGIYSSASAIRKSIISKINFYDNVPQNTQQDLADFINHNAVDYNLFNNILLNHLRAFTLINVADNSENLLSSLNKASLNNNDLNNVFEQVKSKRYTFSRIKRIVLQNYFSITKYIDASKINIPFNLLGIKNKFKHLIKDFPENIIIQTKDLKNYENNENNDIKYILEIQKKAEYLYALLTRQNKNLFYSNKLIIV